MPWQDAYARIGTRFQVKDDAHPNGHRGQDFPLPNGGGSFEYAYEECTVVLSGVEVTRGFTSILGYYTVAKAKSDGRYLFWCHLRKSSRPPVGRVLKPGDSVGMAANGPKTLPLTDENYPGTAWTAPHVHTGVGDTISSVFYGNVFDPLPRIQAAIRDLATASSGITPIQAPKEWDEMATKDEIRDVVKEVVAQALVNSRASAIISYSSPDPERNGIVLAGLDFWHKYTGEEFDMVYQGAPVLFAHLPIITPINDRHYDLFRAVYTGNDAD